jgi:pyruvate formate lyase activating enzyme
MANQWNTNSEKYNLHQEWNDTQKEAYLYDKLSDGNCKCRLCPRTCTIPPGQVGFCKVRKNIDGTLYAQSYGKATHVAVEKVETEAVFHFKPGADILSLGNFGCNLDCDYCQNWMYSQFQYTNPGMIHTYTSEQVVSMARKNNIGILSWTYNDPAVWFEFVIDTAKMAKENGIVSLFKSAYFLSQEALRMIIDVCDCFAVSIKAIDKEYYKKFTKGWLEPVLDCAKTVHKSGKHVEVSNLIVTDLTNNENEYMEMINFIKNELSPLVPLHFTRFHPDYKYTNVDKTPLADVRHARDLAYKNGLKHVYVGNVFNDDSIHSYCLGCGEKLIERYGLTSRILDNLDEKGHCKKCGADNHFVL